MKQFNSIEDLENAMIVARNTLNKFLMDESEFKVISIDNFTAYKAWKHKKDEAETAYNEIKSAFNKVQATIESQKETLMFNKLPTLNGIAAINEILSTIKYMGARICDDTSSPEANRRKLLSMRNLLDIFDKYNDQYEATIKKIEEETIKSLNEGGCDGQ